MKMAQYGARRHEDVPKCAEVCRPEFLCAIDVSKKLEYSRLFL